MAFILRNLRHVQSGASFNSLSELEIPEAVFEELLVNAELLSNLVYGKESCYVPVGLT
jgi:hypothetical protein